MEKYKSKKELNLFKLWGIKKMNNPLHTLEKIGAANLHQGSYYKGERESDEDDGLPESNDEGDGGDPAAYRGGHKRINKGRM